MELREVFAGNWRPLIAVPAVTAIVAAGLFASSSDDRFEAEAVVSMTEFMPDATAASVRASLDDFDRALQSERVGRAVEDAAPTAETLRISSEPVGDGGEVAVTFEAATAVEAEAGLDAGVRTALILISESTGRQIERRLAAADAAALTEEVTLRGIESEVGVTDLQAELDRRSGDLLGLRNQIAAAVGDPALQESLAATFEAKRIELDEIEQRLLPWTRARARLDQAVEAGAEASLSLREIEESQSDLNIEDLLQTLTVTQQSNVLGLLRAVVPAMVVTGGAVVLIVLFLGSQQGPGRRRETATEREGALRSDDDGWDAGLIGDDVLPERELYDRSGVEDFDEFDDVSDVDDADVDDEFDDQSDGDEFDDQSDGDEFDDQSDDDRPGDEDEEDLTDIEASSNEGDRVGTAQRRR